MIMACLKLFSSPAALLSSPMVRKRALIQLGAVVALAAIVVVAAILLSGGDDPATKPSSSASKGETDLYAGIPQAGIHLGKASAPATLVEIADLQCPFCAAYSREALPTVVRDYVRTAGAAAYAASVNRMYQFADAFYRNQGVEESGYADRAFIESTAR